MRLRFEPRGLKFDFLTVNISVRGRERDAVVVLRLGTGTNVFFLPCVGPFVPCLRSGWEGFSKQVRQRFGNAWTLPKCEGLTVGEQHLNFNPLTASFVLAQGVLRKIMGSHITKSWCIMFLVCCAFIYPNASPNNSKQGAITLPLTSSPQLFVGEESKLEITSMSRTLVNSTLADASFFFYHVSVSPPKKEDLYKL